RPPPPPSSTLLPYTTLFRSCQCHDLLRRPPVPRPPSLLPEVVQHRQRHGPVQRPRVEMRPSQPACDQRRSGAFARGGGAIDGDRSEEHTSELQSRENLVCRL